MGVKSGLHVDRPALVRFMLLGGSMLTWDDPDSVNYCLHYERLVRALRESYSCRSHVEQRHEIGVNTPLQHSAWFITPANLNTLSVPLRPPIRSRVANVLRTRLSGFFSASKANLRNAP
jgi:hypothetical protein